MLLDNKKNGKVGEKIRENISTNSALSIISGLFSIYGFEKLNFELITADAFIDNKHSTKIIEKFMLFDKQFYNQKDDCIDRRYKLSRKNWLTLKS